MKKRNIIVLILLLAIGFASVATTLYINGTANIAANKDDFNIYFSEAMLDDENVTDKVIINNGKNIKFETKTLKSIGEYTTLEYEVTNASKNYDASVTMKCSFDEEQNEFVYITNTMINKVIKARTAEKGSIVITLSNSVVEDFSLDIACELEFNAIERNEIAEGDIVSSDINTYSFYGYFVDEEDTPIKNANLVMYSEEPKYIKTDTRGYFYISGLEKGEHELYYVKDKTIDELKALSKDKIKEDATANVTLTTEDNESDEVEFDEEYKITSSIIEKTTNRTYTITLEPNGGKLENTTYEVTQNRQYGVLPTPVREGYIFLGWYLGTQKIEGDYLVTESGEHTLTAEWTNNLDFPFSMGDGVFYFLKGSSCDFTEIIESLGKSVDDFSSNNFKAVIADQTLSTSINKPATGGQSTGTNATSSLSISYNKNTGNCSVTTSNASGKSAYTTINTWTTPNNDGVYQHNKTNYYSTSTAISKIIVFGIIFDPSDEPFSH